MKNLQIEKNSTDEKSNNSMNLERVRLMDIKQVSKYTSIKERTIRSYVYQDKIPFIKINKMVRFDQPKIDKWIDGFNCNDP